jgi:hypothetical protein
VPATFKHRVFGFHGSLQLFEFCAVHCDFRAQLLSLLAQAPPFLTLFTYLLNLHMLMLLSTLFVMELSSCELLLVQCSARQLQYI